MNKHLFNKSYHAKLFLIYLFACGSLLAIFFLFGDTYRNLVKYNEISQENAKIHSAFQDLSIAIKNAAVSNPVVTASTYQKDRDLVLAGRQSVILRVNRLRQAVKDSSTTRILNQLEGEIRSGLPWILQSSTANSNTNQSPQRTLALRSIDSLIAVGISSTSFLDSQINKKLQKTIYTLHVWMILFVLFSFALLFYTILRLFWQRSTIEKRFRALVEHSADIIAMLDKNLVPLYRSPSAQQATGFSSRDRKKGIMIEEIHPEDRDKFNDCIASVHANPGKVIPVSYRIKHKDGRYVYLEGAFNNLLNDPSIKAIVVNMRDVTTRKIAEEAFLATLTEKNIILESIGDAFFAVDKAWTVLYWNNQSEKILGKLKTEVLGNNLWEVFSESVNSTSYKKYYEAIETNKMVHFEDYYEPLNKWYEISAYPSGNGLSIYFKDVTDRKYSEARLQDLNQNLSKQAKELSISNSELEQFAYVASHDLQEPLRMITSFLTQLEKKYSEVLDEKGKRYIYFAVDGAKRMRQIILDLLEFSRVGQVHEEMESINVNEIISDIKILFSEQIQGKKARIKTFDLPVIKGYLSPIRQIFQNLISNALKYTRENIPPEIRITATELEDKWEFSVSDNGLGINEEYFDKIFVIFQRLHTKDEFPGTGMGLAITKKIVESMGGKIWLKSLSGAGSIFYFTIKK